MNGASSLDGAVVAVAAGGTGGHLFPAEALTHELRRRGARVHLLTDVRGGEFSSAFEEGHVHIVPSETMRGRGISSAFKMASAIARGYLKSRKVLRQIGADVLVSFGGYPTVPPGLAASAVRVPLLLHEQNAVLGRANRILMKRAAGIATCFETVQKLDGAAAEKAVLIGNPVRPAVSAARTPYVPPAEQGDIRLLIFGGSQGARYFSDISPDMMATLEEDVRARLFVTQQCRPEDMKRVQAAYDGLGLRCELAPFFKDLPQRMAAAHLVISRAGASTVTELAELGRPSILIPLPGSLDQDQMANARNLEQAGGAIAVAQSDFSPTMGADLITGLMAGPHELVAMSNGAATLRRSDAVTRLADMVASISRRTEGS